MRHERIREALALYAAGVLDGADAAALERHLQTCVGCSRALRALEDDLTGLAQASLEPDWRDHERLRADFRARLAQTPQDAPATSRSLAAPAPSTRTSATRHGVGRYGWPIVWAATVLVAAGGWGLALRDRAATGSLQAIGTLAAQGRRIALTPAHAQAARVALYVGSSQALVAVAGLPRLGPGQVYEGWWIVNGAPRPAGTFGPGLAVLRRQVHATAFAITIEPAPGTTKPTTPVLAAATL